MGLEPEEDTSTPPTKVQSTPPKEDTSTPPTKVQSTPPKEDMSTLSEVKTTPPEKKKFTLREMEKRLEFMAKKRDLIYKTGEDYQHYKMMTTKLQLITDCVSDADPEDEEYCQSLLEDYEDHLEEYQQHLERRKHKISKKYEKIIANLQERYENEVRISKHMDEFYKKRIMELTMSSHPKYENDTIYANTPITWNMPNTTWNI